MPSSETSRSRSGYIVRMSTRELGATSAMARVAVAPSVRGMSRSMRITCGCTRFAIWIASSPLVASATMVMSGQVRSSARIPERTIV